MRVLHIKTNPPWFDEHFNVMCEKLGFTGETQGIYEPHFTEAKANEYWAKYRDYYDSFDSIFISHTAPPVRIFLQNGWTKPLNCWFWQSFDMDVPDKPRYNQLILEGAGKPNVKFFSVEQHELRYARRILGRDFQAPVVPPFIFVKNETKLPTPHGGRLVITPKANETRYMDLKQTLDQLGVPVYCHPRETGGAPDWRGIKAIIHVPYCSTPRSLYENWALENVYLVPSQEFFSWLHYQKNFWYGTCASEDISISQWWSQDHQDLFIYFDSFEHLKQIVNSPNFDAMIEDRKRNIRVYNEKHNTEALAKWRKIFDLDK